MIDNTNLKQLENTVYPETSIDQVVDKESGRSLDFILAAMQAEIDRLKNDGYHMTFGNCIRPETTYTSFAEIYKPGLYYFTSAEMANITDAPEGTSNGGFFENFNKGDGDRIQYYTKNNQIYSLAERYHRVILADGRASAWSMECHMVLGTGSPVGVVTGGTGRFFFDTTDRKLWVSKAVDAWAWELLNP